MGLMDYKARFYDPTIGRFIQPDSIIPSIGNPQSLNRFTYVSNRPIILNDPWGNKEACGAYGPDCEPDPIIPPRTQNSPNGGGGSGNGEGSNNNGGGTTGGSARDGNGGSGSNGRGGDSTKPGVPSLPPQATVVGTSGDDASFAWSVPSSWDLDPSHPDYEALTVNIYFVAVEFTQDRYGQHYIGPGLTLGTKTVVPFGVVSSGGYIGSATDNDMPNFAESKSFLTGSALNVGAGAGTLGGGVTFSAGNWIMNGTASNTHQTPIAWESSTYYVPAAAGTLTLWNFALP